MALADNIGFFADIQGIAYVVIGNQYTDAPVPQVVDNLFDVADRDGVYAGEGLVQENEIRLCRQRPGDLDATA